MLPRTESILYCAQMGPNAPYVFRWAYALATRFDARVHILYVIEQILSHITSTAADMVVVGAHRRSSVVDSLVGSTARKLTERSPVPVLTIQVPQGEQSLSLPDV